ncbi:hypothetical protein CLOP_g755 [Closterium sp. NIES-67]|nr:hypothetical protein CLOP_g755 [Closterium sp. NIES-67]
MTLHHFPCALSSYSSRISPSHLLQPIILLTCASSTFLPSLLINLHMPLIYSFLPSYPKSSKLPYHHTRLS